MSNVAWRQRAQGRWLGTDIDGYKLTVEQRGDAWHWRLRPPGGGYDLQEGKAASVLEARHACEASLAALSKLILKTRRKRGGSG